MSWGSLPVTLHLWSTLQREADGRAAQHGAAQPIHCWAGRPGLRTPGAVGSVAGRECIGFVRILLPNLAPSQTHPAPGKRALLTSPGPALRTFYHPPGGKGTAGSLVLSEAHPRSPCSDGALGAGKGLSSPPQVSLARSEVLGAPGWSWGLNPDHKARELTGISGQMLLAKPLGLQGPDRKPSSFPVASLPPSRQPLGFGDCPDRGLLPEVRTSPWEICGHPSRRCSLKGAVISDRSPRCYGWDEKVKRSQARSLPGNAQPTQPGLARSK